ncbi:hypothetical protein Clacol_001408 [Clathrus columnatus]|uniref:CUE domain-containing protein n=1 Tax=Clathrus columnatus TaxID=1419009 RepID=A0AAV5A1W0_9AGAM|nr:hypothetical protein Clacol_001408 [Clathrus columnatus]
MSFANAPISKGLMMGLGAITLMSSLFDIKHYFHLQFSPHLTRHHQSFITVSSILSSALSFITLFGLQRTNINVIPAGPISILFSILYQYYRLVPPAYSFQIFMLKFSNKAFLYVLAYQLAMSQLPGSAAAAVIGILTGQLYRSDILGLRNYRLPIFIQRLGVSLLPYIGSTRPARRSNIAMPEGHSGENDETITTAPSQTRNETDTTNATEVGRSVMSQWVNQLTGQASASGIRVPTEAEISQITTMFPDLPRESVVLVLQRSTNVEEAVETLLAANNS